VACAVVGDGSVAIAGSNGGNAGGTVLVRFIVLRARSGGLRSDLRGVMYGGGSAA
jgi:hypothetical protein